MVDGVPSARFGLALLGRFELTGPDGAINLASGKLAGLLAYLACNAPRPQSREKLSALLWGSHFDAQAKQNLRQALARLRRVLGQDALQGDGEVVWLNAATIESDVSRFEALIREGSRDALSAAADLYRGPLVDDVAVRQEGWSEWLVAERERLLDLALGALVQLGEQELAAGRAEHALKAGRRAIALNNMREDAHRLVVQALVAAGRKAEALKHYQDLASLLKRELNAEPDAATRSLVAELGRPQPPSGSPAAKIAQPASGSHETPSERRQLTIIACNMVNTVAFSALLDPEDMRDLIAIFHKVVADAVSRFDGFVAQYLNDSVRVYFGYPAAREHDTEQAVRAGLAICDAIGKLRAASGVVLQARVGIATGLVVVGEQLGPDDADHRVAIGETPDIAARLQAAAPPGAVLIAASTYRLVGRTFDCRALGAGEVRGLPQPAEAWQVSGEAPGVSRFEARRSAGLSTFVGRLEEIELLQRRWGQAKSGEGRVVLLSGEPGIGKSRIAESLLARLEAEPPTLLRYFCSPHHIHSPLHPFIAQLEQAAGFEPGSDARTRLDRLEAVLRPTSKNVSRDVSLLAELLGVTADARYPVFAASPQQKREMILTALRDRLDGLAAQCPVLIVFEDAHWIDPTSLELLDRMVARAADLPVLLVITFRPELEPTWIGQPHVTTLPLSRLGRRDSASIIGGVARKKVMPDTVVEQVLAQADGVPLFIEELTTTLLESGSLRETSDSYVLAGARSPLAVPTTLQASLSARLDRLGPGKDVAVIGAAIGREFSHELVAAVSPLAPEDLDAALERLVASGLVYRRGMPPDTTYLFKHALVQDAAYAVMLRSRRRQLHASVAKVLVEQFPALAESQPEVVARHFTEAGLASESIGYWVKAGRLAHARWANREAVEFFEQALHALKALPEGPPMQERAFDIILEQRPVLIQLGEPQLALERLREAETLAERLCDDRRRGWICALMTNVHSLVRELDDAQTSGTRALEIAGRLGDLRLRIPATSYLEQAHYYRGEYKPVVALATDNLAVLPAAWADESFGMAIPPAVWDRCYLMLSLAQLGRFAKAADPQADAIRLAEATQQVYAIGLVHFVAGWVDLLRGNWTQAHQSIEHATAVWRAGNVANMLPTSIAYSAWVLAQLGEVSEALSRLREGERLFERHATGKYFTEFGILHALGHGGLVLGRLDAAERIGERAIELYSHHHGWRAHMLHLLGDIATHPDRFDAESGEAYYRQALELAEPRGMSPLIAHCHFGLGKLYQRTQKQEQVREHLTTAISLYRDMDMRFWQAQAQERLT
ncbi:Transcriptional regulatory protein, C terminal [Rhodospirillales bacterium URHD0017]|nr:Transcriptional regulatory protein, C terminal [Rhodospirillales bacterium URHD0017]